MILITGAGGKTGKAIVKALSKIENISIFIHREEQISAMESLGVERVTIGDMSDKSAIHSAIQGARAVYHICPNMSTDEVKIGRLMLDDAKRAGVEHFVYHSVLHPQTEKMKHHWAKLRVEEMIFESGVPFTILQPAPYMQNLLANWKSLVGNGILPMPYSTYSKFSFVDLEDIAEAAKIMLTEPGHKNATYELAGTYTISHEEVAEILSRALNRDVHAEKEEIRDWRSRASGVNEYALENLVRMFEYYDQWGLAGNPNVLKWILKREPTSLESFFERIVKENYASH